MHGKDFLLIIAALCELGGVILAFPDPYRHTVVSAVALGILFYFISLMM